MELTCHFGHDSIKKQHQYEQVKAQKGVHTLVTLSYEDFSDFPIGNVSDAPYTALGEYHVIDPKYYQGNWHEATYWHGWKGLGNWRVVEEDGRHVMEQTLLSRDRIPMLVTGSEYWRDYRYTVEIRPFSLQAPVGVAFAYEHSRSYFVAVIERDCLSIARRRHEEYEILASCPYAPNPDRYQILSLCAEDRQVTVSVDGTLLLETETSQELRGKVGLYASAPCRYANVRVETEASIHVAIHSDIEKEQAELSAVREQYPQPQLWKRLRTPDFGTDRNIRFGDLDGDGRLEMVLAQTIQRIDAGNFPGICTLTAMDLDGKILWQMGESYPQHRYTTADTCFQVHDIDGDGYAEVIFTKDFRLQIADGRTGEIKKSVPTPPAQRDSFVGGPYYERVMGDSLCFANFSGGPHAQEIVLKDRYAHIWVYDKDLNLLWTHELETGHYPTVADVDGDGRDELQVGATLFSPDGQVLWSLELEDHVDGVALVDLKNDGEILSVMAAGEAGILVADLKGHIRMCQKYGHIQKLAIGRFRSDLPGLMSCTINFWGEPGITCLFDADLNLLRQWEPIHYASPLAPVNWVGDGTELILLSTHPKEGGMLDGFGRRVVMFPADGHPYLCARALDVTGDGREEILTWDKDEIWIYTQDRPAPEGAIYAPHKNPLCNDSNYKASYSVPW